MTPRQRRQILASAVLIGGTVLSLVTFLHGEMVDVVAAGMIAVITSGAVASVLGP